MADRRQSAVLAPEPRAWIAGQGRRSSRLGLPERRDRPSSRPARTPQRRADRRRGREPRRRRRIAASSRIGGDPERARRRGFPPAGVVGRRRARGPDV